MHPPDQRQSHDGKAKPFIKWAGGKGRLLSQLEPLLPDGVEHMRYVEPFLGGGALFFHQRPERAILADLNASLVSTYEAVRDEVDDVIAHLARLASAHSVERYYRVRDRYNAGGLSRAEHAATFIYLTKTCFNGLHRVNKKGKFNVAAGRYKNPRILDEDTLRAASHALANAELRHASFDALLEYAQPGDFVYIDPPYAPVSETASFTSYAEDGFGPDDQVRLRDVYRALDRRGCRLMLSNSNIPFIRELYHDFRIDTVTTRRSIAGNAEKRGLVSEVVVRNY